MSTFTIEDEAYMRRALKLAVRGQGRVEPNPMVGCVIVRDGRIIGAGYHRRFGGPHAEVAALRRCTESPRGATVYITLEPCCYFGKTPPCTDALVGAGVARVVAAMTDPYPRVAGGGLSALRRAGVRVDLGLLAREAQQLNAPFIKLTNTGRPWVILKWAQSLDGKIATSAGESRWITDRACRAHAHRTRGRVDAILVGVGTVLRDDPLLTCRASRPRRLAARIVLDTNLRVPPDSRLVRTAGRVATWVFCARNASARRARRLERAGCVLHRVATVRGGVSLRAVLDTLGRRRMTNVLVEGGGQVLGRFFDQRLADEFQVYIAPLLIGGRAAPGPLNMLGASRLSSALQLPPTMRMKPVGNGYFLAARVGAP